MNTTIYCPDITCESCVKILSKALQKEGIKQVIINHDAIEVSHDDNITEKELIRIIQENGYRASLNAFDNKTLFLRVKEFFTNKEKYEIEYRMIKYSILALAFLCTLDVLAYYALFKNTPDFVAKYAWWLFYTNLAVVSIGAAIWHLKSYKSQVTHMVGMMIGMTFGMQTGMMLGTIIGATNGLFVGGTVSMLIAVGVGYYNGKCCGIMGIMEGMTAGVMGGVMGSMIGTMFSVDHIFYFMPIFILVNILIMLGLSIMLYEEMVEDKKVQKKQIDFITYMAYCLIATTILTLFIIYGPKTGLASLA